MSVVNVKVKYIRPKYDNLEEWIKDKNNVYIGRKGVVFIKRGEGKERFPKADSIWANPFKIDEKNGVDRDKVIELYREYITDKIKKEPELVDELLKLEGKNLGCWCVEPNSKVGCHGNILVELINKYK